MGQAAVDLPDPLGQEPLDKAPSADDLLAQMAGEEVDRLLAEAELEGPGKEGAAAPTAPVGGGATSQPPIAPAPEAHAEKASETAAPAAAAGPNEVARALDEADPETAKQLDALFAELNASPAEQAPAPASAPAETPAQPAKTPAESAESNTTTPPAAEVPMDQQLDALFAELNASPVEPVSIPERPPAKTPAANSNETTPPAPEVPMDQQLDDLFAQLTAGGDSSPQEPAPASESPAAATTADAPATPTPTPAPASVQASAPKPVAPPAQVAPPAEAAPVETPAVEAPAVAKTAAPTEPAAEKPPKPEPKAEEPTPKTEAKAAEPAPKTEPKLEEPAPKAAEPPKPEPKSTEKPALDPQDQTGPLEKQVLSAAIPTPIEGAEIVEPRTSTASADQKLPLWLRLLELFDAPLAMWGDGVRDAVGKVAIMTLMNAVALLTYVLVFRRH